MIRITQKGDFSKTTRMLNKAVKPFSKNLFDKYGKKGVAALAAATPVDSGKTASSWFYKIENQNGRISIIFYNSNINNGVQIAIILQYGHTTRNGGWVQGRDYINPAIQPVFDEMVKEAWKEVIS